MSIKCVELYTGRIFIGEWEETKDTSDSIVLKEVLEVKEAVTPHGLAIAVMPVGISYAKEQPSSLVFTSTAVMFFCDPAEKLEQAYKDTKQKMRMAESGLVLASGMPTSDISMDFGSF